MSIQPFHPGTAQMLRAAQQLHRRVDPAAVEALQDLLPRLFTGRLEGDRLLLDSCGSHASRLFGLEGRGLNLLARFPQTDRAAVRLMLVQAQAEDAALVARVLARLPLREARKAELVLAPLLRRADGSSAVLGLLQPLQPWSAPLLELRALALHLAPPNPRAHLQLVIG